LGWEQDEIYVEIPPQYGLGPSKVWRLKRAFYGLRQAALRFQQLLESILVGMGFEVCAVEPVLFDRRESEIRLLVHIGDPLVSAPFDGVTENLFGGLSKRVKVNALNIIGEEPVTFLGARLQRFEDSIVERSKPGYLEGALEAAGMERCAP